MKKIIFICVLFMLNSCIKSDSLKKLAEADKLMRQSLPGHFRINSDFVRIENNPEMGCWIAFMNLAPSAEIYYNDDDNMLHQKIIPIQDFIVWLKKQGKMEIWIKDYSSPLNDTGKFFNILDIEDYDIKENKVYFKIYGDKCSYHEGVMTSAHGKIDKNQISNILN